MARLGGLKAAAYRGRSDLYRWMRNRHAKLIEMGIGQKDGPTWKAVAAAAAKAGQANRKGEPPSEDTVRRVWSRVCRDEVAAKANQAKAQAALFPTLRPVPQTKRNPVAPQVVAPIVPRSRQPPAQETDEELAQRTIAELRAGFRERSR